MKFTGIFAVFAAAGTAFSAAIPRQSSADPSEFSGIIKGLDSAISFIEPKLCSNVTQDDITKFEGELSSIKNKLSTIVPADISKDLPLSDAWSGVINKINGFVGKAESAACNPSPFSLLTVKKFLTTIEGLLGLVTGSGSSKDALAQPQAGVSGSALFSLSEIVKLIKNGFASNTSISSALQAFGLSLPSNISQQ